MYPHHAKGFLKTSKIIELPSFIEIGVNFYFISKYHLWFKIRRPLPGPTILRGNNLALVGTKISKSGEKMLPIGVLAKAAPSYFWSSKVWVQ